MRFTTIQVANFDKQGLALDQVAFFRRVHQTMGGFRPTQVLGANFNTTTKGTTFILNYSSDFERGNARENFTWFLKDGQAKLFGYHIDSQNFK